VNNLLPIFLNLENQKCLIVGGGTIAFQKLQQLLESNALVTVVAPDIDQNIIELPVKVMHKCYDSTDLEDMKVIIAATNDEKVNKNIYNDSIKIGIPVNVVDQPHLCSFYMGSVFQDGDLKIAISTNGSCPSFGTYLRDYIKNISKGLWGNLLTELAQKRKNIINTLSSYDKKKKTMNQIVGTRLKGVIDSDKLGGKVYLVGAGPGDPDLITVKGKNALQIADFILHDALIHPSLVDDINPLAKKIFVGKRAGKHSISQDSIHSIMIKEATAGKQVVRLKGGDPFIFGRGGEEVLALAKKGVPFEVVPGITSAIGAAAAFGIPLTHRDHADSVLFITGHQSDLSLEEDWRSICSLSSTLVFYMGIKRINEIVNILIKNGKSKSAPIAIVQNATLINQKIFVSTLNKFSEEIDSYKIKTPALIIVGEVINYHKFFENSLNVKPSNVIDQPYEIGFDVWKAEDLSIS
tara:strand:- start:6094 stop:7488 length:1395 start_codon:yes stop_codon:yes gene_type:complete